MQPSDFVSIYCELAEIIGIENTEKVFLHFRPLNWEVGIM